MIKLILIFVLILSIGIVFEEAEGINPIKGYVSEAKEKARAEAEAKANATQNKPEPEKEDTTNRSDDLVVVKEIKKLLGIEENIPKKQYAKIIGIQLSRTCLQMEKYNVSSNCPTYKDLLQFDNTMKSMSGSFTNENGVWTREKSNYKDHCNFYHPAGFPLLIVVDPDGCWQRERGIKMIFINAITPDKMLYKLTADKSMANNLRDLNRDQIEHSANKQDSKDAIERLEDKIDSQEITINNLEDQTDDKDLNSLQKRNINFQLRFARDALDKMQTDLIAEEIKLDKYTRDLNATKSDLQIVKTDSSSRFVIDGTTSMGVGRYVEECRNATVGADMNLITDTINYLITNCDQTTFDSIKTTYIEPTPINIMDHKFYQFMKWQKDAIERCKELC